MTWKQIPDYDGIYLVSDNGDIKALDRYWVTGKNLLRYKPEHIMKKFKKSNGYYHVQLTKDGIMKQFPIHRLVACSFLQNPDNKKCVNHRNGIKTDNRVENLEWCSYSENNIHALKNKLRISPSGSNNGYSKSVTINGITYATVKEYGEKNGLTKYQAYYRCRKLNRLL